MADGTSVGKVYLDVEVSKESINAELNKLGKVFSNGLNNSFKGMFSGMASQMNGFVKDSIGKMNSGFKNFSQSASSANEKVSQSINKMNAEYEKTEYKIADIRSQLAQLFAEQDTIARGYQGMPAFSGMSKEASMEQMLKSNPRYNELSAEIQKLTVMLDPLISKNKILGDEIKNAGNQAADAGNKVQDMGNKSNKAGGNIDKASKKTSTFGDILKRSGTQAGGFANMFTRSLMTVLRRLFVYNLILKGLRGMMSYMGAALKTNKQFVSSLNAVKTNLRVAFQPIYDFILPAINALMRAVATVTTYIAAAISALFGKTYKQSYDGAKGIETAKKAMDGYGQSAKKAQNTLMGFDEINQLDIQDDSDSGGTGGYEMEMPDTSTIDLSGMEAFKAMFADIFKPFQDAWANEGNNTVNAVKYALDSLKGVIKSIGDSWMEVWTNGTGQLMLETILRIVQNIFNFIGNIADAFSKAWKTNEVGTKIIQGIFDLLNIVLGTIERITFATAEWAKTLDFTPLLNSIDTLLQALAPLTQNIGGGLVWFWKNALLPISSWVVEDAVPVFLGVLSEAIKVLNNVIEALKPLGLWLWENFLKPLGEWTGGIIVETLEGIKEALTGLGDWITNNKETTQAFFALFASWKATTFVIEMGKATAAIIANTIATIAGKIETIALIGLYTKDAIAKGASTLATWAQVAATTAWNVVASIATGVTTAFGAAMAFITSPIGLAVAAIAGVIAIGVLLYKNWDEISLWLKELWEGIKTKATEIWTAIKDFFVNTWESIKTKTSEVWNGIKSFLENTIWNPIKNKASEIWTGIKDNVINPINSAWNSLKEIWDKIKTYILGKWDEIKLGISNKASALVDAIKSPFITAKEWIDSLIEDAFNWGKNLVDNIVSGIKSVASKIGSSLTSAFSSGSSGGGGSGTVKGTGYSQLQDRSKDMNANMDSVIKYGKKNNLNYDTGTLYDMWKAGGSPKLARGGIVDQPTLAMVGERGKEAVIPFENSGFLEALTGSIVNALLQILPLFSGQGSNGSYDDKELVVNIEGTPLVRILLPLINNELSRLGYRTLFQVN